MKRSSFLPAAGDVLALGIVTLAGFATHGEADLALLPRMAASFLPLTLSWFLLAPWFGMFERGILLDPRQIWRPALAMILAAPLAAILRGLILNTPVIPIFALVLGAASSLGMLVWRAIFLLVARENQPRG
jgi:hypothetical protein